MRTSRVLLPAFAAAIVVACSIAPAGADVLPFWLKIEKVLANGAEVGDIAVAPGGELWVLERTTGIARVFVAGTQKATLAVGVTSTCESGLLDVAFAPDYAASGRAFLSYVDATGVLRVDRVQRTPAGIELAGTILTLGSPAGGCRPGGGLEVGPDGKLYVGVGDNGTAADARDAAKLQGKVLRANLDGSVPSDNPTAGSLVFAKGFRDPKDLDVNPSSSRVNGTLYATELGVATTASDEIDAVRPGGDYGWNLTSGSSGGTYDDPLVSYASPVVRPEAVASLARGGLGPKHLNALAYACADADDVRETFPTGADLASPGTVAVLFDPDADRDGTPDTGCPRKIGALAEGLDGELYAANYGTAADNPGIWRIFRDAAGPREVSANGSPFPLTVDKSGSNLLVGWENLGALDTGRPARNGGQRSTRYEVWQGSLPIVAFDHVGILGTDGVPDGPARLTATVPSPAGSAYFLVSAQGDNLEGSLGAKTNGTPRPGASDYCDTIGWGIFTGKCAAEFRNPVDQEVLKLTDYNPSSPTYMQALSISDFRGRVVKMDISSDNCFWCNVQADQEPVNDTKYRDRDFLFVTILTQSYAGVTPIPPANCASVIGDWASRHSTHTPILCDTDLNGDNHGDVSWQYWHPGTGTESCGGTPQNFYVDQGNVLYSFVCGAQLSGDVESRIATETNPETCE